MLLSISNANLPIIERPPQAAVSSSTSWSIAAERVYLCRLTCPYGGDLSAATIQPTAFDDAQQGSGYSGLESRA